MEVIKFCKACSTNHPLDAFYKKGDRYDAECKECIKKKKRNKRKQKLKRKSETLKRRTKFRVITPDPSKVVEFGKMRDEVISLFVVEVLKEAS